MGLHTILQIVIVVLNGLLLFFLLSQGPLEDRKNKALAVSAGIIMLHIGLECVRFHFQLQFLLPLTCALTFIYGPVAYLLVIDWGKGQFPRDKVFLHFAPAAFAFVLYNPDSALFLGLHKGGLSASFLIYAFAGIKKVREKCSAAQTSSAGLSRLIVSQFVVVGGVGALNLYLQHYDQVTSGYPTIFGVPLPPSGFMTLFAISCISVIHVAIALSRPNLMREVTFLERGPIIKYKAQASHEERGYLTRLAVDVQMLLHKDEQFCDPDLTVGRIARQMLVSERDVSRAVNLVFDKKFPDMVAELRLEKAKALLRADREAVRSVTDIQLECGFNTKSNFYRAFNLATGLAPTQYRNAARSDSEAVVSPRGGVEAHENLPAT